MRPLIAAIGCAALAGWTVSPSVGFAAYPSQGGGPTSASGSLCLAPIAAPTAGTKSLHNPTGGNPVPDYTVQLDDRPPVQLDVFTTPPAASTAEWIWQYPQGQLLRDVSLTARHTIVIRHGGRPIESFRFELDADAPDQCIFLNDFYLTWQLWPRRRAPWCKCGAAGPRG